MDECQDKLWQNYWQKRDNDSITGLINVYIHIIKKIAEDVIDGYPDREPIDDLYTSGIFALKDCILTYPKNCQVEFEEFCRDKVRQAMVGELENYPNRKPLSWLEQNSE